jgi:hypothetical protein
MARMPRQPRAKPEPTAEKQTSEYDALKEFGGRRYRGMRVGRGHKWHYDPGVWTEKKVTPDKWDVHFAVNKRRAGRAPEGSGAPVGTSHHWFLLADQVVTKVDANTYTTELSGTKHMLAYRKAGAEKWSAGEKGQRNHLIRILQAMIAELEAEADPTSATQDPGAAKVAARRPAAQKRKKDAASDPPQSSRRPTSKRVRSQSRAA